MKLLLILVFAATLFNTGLIWTVQLVHYPGFLKMGVEKYIEYQQFHMKAITYLVGPSMLIELVLSVILLFMLTGLPDRALYVASFLILIGIWFHTAFWASPIHGKLLNGFSEDLARSLIHANWWRTIGWTLRAFLLGFILMRV